MGRILPPRSREAMAKEKNIEYWSRFSLLRKAKEPAESDEKIQVEGESY